MGKTYNTLFKLSTKGFDYKSDKGDNCDKCGKIPANIDYKGKKYCTWYCAKK